MDEWTRTAFVGRRPEIAKLESALEATMAGRGVTALVAGDAGIGKTRLVSELGVRARAVGFDVLLGRSIDLVGTELPYQPFIEALGPLRAPPPADKATAGWRVRMFHESAALLFDRADAAPVLLVLEDLHWADTSTLDLFVFLAHNVVDRRVMLLGTYRADESTSSPRMHRFAGGVRRSGAAVLLELGPLPREELIPLLAAQAGPARSAALLDAIVARSEGNPFFAQELLAGSIDVGDELPRGLRDLLLQRVARLDRATQSLLRLAAAAGRDVGYPLLAGAAAQPDHELRESLRQAIEHGVLTPDRTAGTFRFRHALLAEAVYATILPGECEELHGRLADELARAAVAPAELAPHWAAAGRAVEALTASVAAARAAEAMFGLAEALSHLERAVAVWPAVPDAAELAGLDLAELCGWTAAIASEVGAARRAVELGRRAIELVGDDDPRRSALLHVRLGEYLHAAGGDDDLLAAFERAVELVPAQPPSPERAYSLGSLGGALMVAGRHGESLPISEQALALSRTVGAREAEVRALTVLGGDLAYLGRAEEGLTHLRQALQLAEEIGDRRGLERAYVNITDALTMLGRPRESARVGRSGLEVTRRYGIESTLLVANQVEALFAIGDWDEAERISATALREATSSFPAELLIVRAAIEIGRGEFDAARAHLEAANAIRRESQVLARYDAQSADLALGEGRWTDADAAVRAGLARQREAAQIRVQLCATGLRAQAELSAFARARRNDRAVHTWLARAGKLIAVARRAAAEASAVTPDAAGWLALADAEYERAHGMVRPESWSKTAATWVELDRRPLAAYCRWRQAEALVAARAPRDQAIGPLREAHAVAVRIGAKPLSEQLDLLAQRARLQLTAPEAETPRTAPGLDEVLGLTPREAEVLALVARGQTNREIAATLVISVRTAGVHVSRILRKLGAPNRVEAAAIAHRARR